MLLLDKLCRVFLKNLPDASPLVSYKRKIDLSSRIYIKKLSKGFDDVETMAKNK